MLKSSRFALGLLLPLTLAACSAPSTPSTPVAFYGDGLDHSWTANAKEGQQLYQSLSNGLKTQGVDMGVTLDITASNGWGPIEVNTSNGETAAGDGKTLTMKGKTYATGLGVHGDSEIHIKATGLVTPACTHFKADIGIDDEVGVNGKFSSVVFQVFADGEKMYDSGLVTGSTPTKSIDIPVGNKSDLHFVVTHGPDLNYYDHADWAGARLEAGADCAPSQATPSVTLDKSSLDIYHLHTGTLKATFNNYPKGTYQLAIANDTSVPVNPQNSNLFPYPLVLQTTQVELSGLPSETKDLVIAAPVNPVTDQGRGSFLLNISGGGTAPQSLPVTLTELPLKISARFEPDTLSGREGETKRAVLVVTVDPPLNAPRALTLDLQGGDITTGTNSLYQIQQVGPLTGTGAEMRQAVDLTFNRYGYPTQYLPKSDQERIGVGIEGVTTGYRDHFYRNGPSALLNLTLLAPQ